MLFTLMIIVIEVTDKYRRDITEKIFKTKTNELK